MGFHEVINYMQPQNLSLSPAKSFEHGFQNVFWTALSNHRVQYTVECLVSHFIYNLQENVPNPSNIMQFCHCHLCKNLGSHHQYNPALNSSAMPKLHSFHSLQLMFINNPYISDVWYPARKFQFREGLLLPFSLMKGILPHPCSKFLLAWNTGFAALVAKYGLKEDFGMIWIKSYRPNKFNIPLFMYCQVSNVKCPYISGATPFSLKTSPF